MKLRITIEGRTYEVDVDVLEGVEYGAAPASAPVARPSVAPAPAAAAPAPAPAPASAPRAAAPVTSDRVCKSPIAGTILKVLTQPGETVALNQVIMVMEAMKMETNIASPVAGTVKSIPVSPGDAVKQGQVLVEYD